MNIDWLTLSVYIYLIGFALTLLVGGIYLIFSLKKPLTKVHSEKNIFNQHPTVILLGAALIWPTTLMAMLIAPRRQKISA